MEVLALGTGKGKTTRMLLWLAENKSHVLLVGTESGARQLQGLYPVFKDRISRFEGARERFPEADWIFGVDEAGYVLQNILGRPIKQMTIDMGRQSE